MSTQANNQEIIESSLNEFDMSKDEQDVLLDLDYSILFECFEESQEKV